MAVNTETSVIIDITGKLSQDISASGGIWEELAAEIEKLCIDDASQGRKNVEYYKNWADDYIRNIRRRISSRHPYRIRIVDDQQMMENIDVSAPAPKVFSEQLNQHYKGFLEGVLGESALLKDCEKNELEKLKVPMESGERMILEALFKKTVQKLLPMLSEVPTVDHRVQVPGLFNWIKGAIDKRLADMNPKEPGMALTLALEMIQDLENINIWLDDQIRIIQHGGSSIRSPVHVKLESDDHPNIARYFGVEFDRGFEFTCLERPICSLYDLIHLYDFILEKLSGRMELELWRNELPSPLLKDLMKDIISGVDYLHDRRRNADLNPRNVLVVQSTHTSRRLTAKLSDMGISKKLKTKHATGEYCQSKQVDLFNLGCILLFCITKGEHPFGKDFEHDDNIVLDERVMSSIYNIPEAVDLISRLMNSNPELRPKAQKVIHHIFFWNSKMLETFLHDISNDLESEGQNSQLVKTLEGALGGEKWTGKIDQQFLIERNQYRQSRGHLPYIDSVQDLLRLIRNSLEHYNQFTKWSQGILGGSSPEGVLAYFRGKFPKLFFGVHKVIWEHCAVCAQEEELYGVNAKWKWKWN